MYYKICVYIAAYLMVLSCIFLLTSQYFAKVRGILHIASKATFFIGWPLCTFCIIAYRKFIIGHIGVMYFLILLTIVVFPLCCYIYRYYVSYRMYKFFNSVKVEKDTETTHIIEY